MISNTYDLWQKDEYNYPLTFGFIPSIVSYIHDDDSIKRPAIIVVPGGGYRAVSETEGEIVAKEFWEKGYNTFVVTYTTNILMKEPLKFQPMNDLSRALRFVRKKADLFHINKNQIAVCGFSAGGHLTASLAVHYEDRQDSSKEYNHISNRPDAVILSYPVITSGKKAHRDSFVALLGRNATKEALEYMSLEKHVTSKTPPTFLWHTASDDLVPVENSIDFANACLEKGIFYEQHIFSDGGHGLSLANDKWCRGEYGRPYTLEQFKHTYEAANKGLIQLPEELKKTFELLNLSENQNEAVKKPATPVGRIVNEGVAIWPILVDHWLKKVFK